jgi:hypothetical protein
MIPVIVSERWFEALPARVRPRDSSVLASAVLLLSAGILAPWILTGVGKAVAPLHELTHGGGEFFCPLCGGTRAFVACCGGEFLEAVRFNPFAVICWAWIAVQVPLRAAALARPPLARIHLLCDRLDVAGLRLFLPLLFGLWIPRIVCFWITGSGFPGA